MYTGNYTLLCNSHSSNEKNINLLTTCYVIINLNFKETGMVASNWNASNYIDLWCLGAYRCEGSRFVNIQLNIVECNALSSCRSDSL